MDNQEQFKQLVSRVVPSKELDYIGGKWIGGLVHCFIPEAPGLFEGTRERIKEDLKNQLDMHIRYIQAKTDERAEEPEGLDEEIKKDMADLTEYIISKIPEVEWLTASSSFEGMTEQVDNATRIGSTFIYTYVWNDMNPGYHGCEVVEAKEALTELLLGKNPNTKYKDAF